MKAAYLPSILLIGPAPHVQGGVTYFTKILSKNIINYKVTQFHVGSNPKTKESSIAKIIRILKMMSSLLMHRFKQHFDIIHINPSFNTPSLLRDGLILLLLRLTGFRNVLVFFHGWDAATATSMKYSPLRSLFVWLMNGTSRILVLAPEYKQTLTELGIRGVHISVASTMYAEEYIPTSGTNLSVRNILFMSRFDHRKGMYELLSAFTTIASEFPDTLLIFAGDGEESTKLRAAAKASGFSERIRFTGYVEDKEKSALLGDAYIFALPTRYPEGMPIVLLEAMAAGLPLLTSKAGGIRQIVHEPDNGVVLDDITADNIAAGLRRLLGDKHYCSETGTRNAAYAREHFSAKKVTADIEAAYDAITQR